MVRCYRNKEEGEIPGIYTFDEAECCNGKIKLIREGCDSYDTIVSITVVDTYKAENILRNLFSDGKYDFTRDGIEFVDEPDDEEEQPYDEEEES